MNDYEKMLTCQRGWGDGAGGRPMNPKLIEHEDKSVVNIYNEGYTAGRADRQKANKRAARKFGITTRQIMLACLR